MKTFAHELRENGDIIAYQGGLSFEQNIRIIDGMSQEAKEDLAKTFKFSCWDEMKQVCQCKAVCKWMDKIHRPIYDRLLEDWR